MKILTSAKIKKFFPNHTTPCVKNFILLMTAILQTRTVCLYKCRDKVSVLSGHKDQQQLNSCYMRLIRFFKMNNITAFINGIADIMFSVSHIDLKYVIVDRSNWKRGKKNINLLTIGGLMNQVFVPFYWLQLNKRGNSKIGERKNLIENVIQLVTRAGKSIQHSILLADREFIGHLWFEYLRSKNISFVIRLREKMYFELQTVTGKKNFVKVVFKTHREVWHLQHTYGVKRHYLHLCND